MNNFHSKKLCWSDKLAEQKGVHMKRCPICGVDEYNMKFEGYLCIDCYRINRNDKHKEDVIKEKEKVKIIIF